VPRRKEPRWALGRALWHRSIGHVTERPSAFVGDRAFLHSIGGALPMRFLVCVSVREQTTLVDDWHLHVACSTCILTVRGVCATYDHQGLQLAP
jgi:hypothetical protein